MHTADQSIVRDGGGIVDYCRLHDITVQAWSPFQSGHFGGVFLGHPEHPELNAVIDRLAQKYDVTPEAIATAWITRHPAQMQRSEEHTSELQSRFDLVCRLLLEKKKRRN